MDTVGAFEAKTHLAALLQRVERGDRITITKHGRPVARLVPITDDGQEARRDAAERLKTFGKQHDLTLGGIDWRTLRDEGRR